MRLVSVYRLGAVNSCIRHTNRLTQPSRAGGLRLGRELMEAESPHLVRPGGGSFEHPLPGDERIAFGLRSEDPLWL